MGNLNASVVRGLRAKGKYLDGDGLSLHVKTPDKRYWTYRFQLNGRERVMTFGNADRVSLADARMQAAQARAKVVRKIDPLAQKDRDREASKAKVAAKVSFADAVTAYVAAHQAGWRGYRCVERWRHSMTAYAVPVFGQKSVAEISVEDVLKALASIWTAKTVTAARVRNRIEMVLDYAKARGWRSGENPAAWKAGLKNLLPAQNKIHAVEHRAALPWREMPGLMEALSDETSVAAFGLRFTILTATRSAETRGACWNEIDMEQKVWTIPGRRMKNGKQHRVALSSAAMDILHELGGVRTEHPLVFPGHARGRPLADTTLRDLLTRLGFGQSTVHGMRSAFADWCADMGHSSDLAEAALGHIVGSAVRRAYARSDLLEMRRGLMQRWADFLTQSPAEVVPLRAAG
jgi:integrase